MNEHVTVLVPTSVSPLHPATDQIEECIGTIRDQPVVGDARIVVMADGVYPQQEHRRAPYDEYVDRLKALASSMGSDGFEVVAYDAHQHQVNMTRDALASVETPCLLFVEHDWALRPRSGPGINWEACIGAVESGDLNVIRFLYPPTISPYHVHMMIDAAPKDVGDVPVVRTAQWSQNPHLASTGFYRKMFDRHLTSRTPSMIEDAIHGVMASAWADAPWSNWWDWWKVAVYAPGWPDQMSQCDHLDGRRGEEPFRPDWKPT